MSFEYHVVWAERVVDRATREAIARRVAKHPEGILKGKLWHKRRLSVVHAPSGRVIAVYKQGVALRTEEDKVAA